jgi:hypothetical protein
MEVPMDALAALLIIVAGVIALDIAAFGWGVDSREDVRDDGPSWKIL